MTITTTTVTLNTSTYVSLGTGPLELQSISSAINVVISDTTPTTGELGFNINYMGTPVPINTTSTVWVIALEGTAPELVYAPISGLAISGTVSSKDAQLVPAGYYQASVTTTAASLATLIGTTLPTNARLVYIEPEVADIRFRDDGTSPTTALGLRIYAGVAWPYQGNLSTIQLVSVTGTVTVNLVFYQ